MAARRSKLVKSRTGEEIGYRESFCKGQYGPACVIGRDRNPCRSPACACAPLRQKNRSTCFCARSNTARVTICAAGRAGMRRSRRASRGGQQIFHPKAEKQVEISGNRSALSARAECDARSTLAPSGLGISSEFLQTTICVVEACSSEEIRRYMRDRRFGACV